MAKKNRRKLIKVDLLIELHRLNKEGVPVAHLVRTRDLDVSLPHLTKLIRYYDIAVEKSSDTHESVVLSSIFPDWLNAEGSDVQVQPDGYKYKGYFPWGEWTKLP